jgi:hypothetical protein
MATLTLASIDVSYSLVPACFVLAGVVLIVVLILHAAKSNGPENDVLETWPCNDCGTEVPKWDELCNACFQKLMEEEEWEAQHPELRCPPRE